MKNILKSMLSVVLLILGALLLFYPQISELILDYQTDQYIEEFNSQYYQNADGEVDIADSAKQESTALDNQIDSDVLEENSIDKESDLLYQEIFEYNTSIFENGQKDFKDAWSYVSSPINISGLDDGKFGYIQIPAMNVRLPLYLGASDANMAKGAVVLGQTSIPIGGNNTNSVIAGHRGWYTGSFFKNIERLGIGDHVFITNPWERLAYEVESIDIVSPYSSEKVKIQEGRDMVTLVTCHPYLSHGNKYRYLVYCVRDENYDWSSNVESEELSNKENSDDDITTITTPDGTTYESSEELIQKESLLRMIGAGIIVFILMFPLIRRIIESVRSRS